LILTAEEWQKRPKTASLAQGVAGFEKKERRFEKIDAVFEKIYAVFEKIYALF